MILALNVSKDTFSIFLTGVLNAVIIVILAKNIVIIAHHVLDKTY